MSDAAVRDVVAVNDPTVTTPEVIAEVSMDEVAVSVPTDSVPTVAFASVAVDVDVSVPEVSEPNVAFEAVSDWMIEVTKFESVAKRLVEVD